MDQNLWQFSHFQQANNDQTELLEPLPLPPDPNSVKWRGRCYNCLQFGHKQNECKATERVCAKCWGSGHEAKFCTVPPQPKRARFDPLQPRGNLGEALLPPNRPKVTNVYIPETNQMIIDAQHLHRAIVIDSRLKANHTMEIVQSVLMAVCKSDFPFPLTHMSGTQYLLLLPLGSDHHHFLLSYDKPLQDLGYVSYPWSPAINGYPMWLKYKVWIELHKMSPQMWTIDHLIAAASSFGIVLEHVAMHTVSSLEKMMVVVAVPDLNSNPEN